MSAVWSETHDELEVLASVAAWAQPFLVGDVPIFGTPEWLALPLDEPGRTAAVVRAALAHWRMGESVEELEARVEAAELKLSSLGISAAEDWSALAYRPSAAELARRRDWHARAHATGTSTVDALPSFSPEPRDVAA